MRCRHIEIDPNRNGNMFFWHFQNQHIAKKQRTVIWVNGGPGCSSEDGALTEVGPYRLKDDGSLLINDGAWNKFANLLFVDNPLGTGFSHVDGGNYTRGLEQMAREFVSFLEEFFAIFPHYSQDYVSYLRPTLSLYLFYLDRFIFPENRTPGNTFRILRNQSLRETSS